MAERQKLSETEVRARLSELPGWELVARLGLVSQLALPPLSDVVLAFIDMVRSGELISNGASSLWRASYSISFEAPGIASGHGLPTLV